MNRMVMRSLGAALLLAGPALAAAQEILPPPASLPPCPPPIAAVPVRVLPVEFPVTLRLGEADAQATPSRHICARTGGGNIDVRQVAPDTVVITMTGVVVGGGLAGASAAFTFDLAQQFTVVAETPAFCGATLSVQARVIGLLRNPCKGSAACGEACVSIACGEGPESQQELVSLVLPGKAVGDKDNQSVLVRKGPITIPIEPGCFTLRQTWTLSALQHLASIPGKPASAEFAPAPALDPTWISYKDPFHGVAKKDFGFQVTLKVTPIKSTLPAQPPGLKVLVQPEGGK
jgi:hypothetical protein